jgi:hypothetical protein
MSLEIHITAIDTSATPFLTTVDLVFKQKKGLNTGAIASSAYFSSSSEP